MAMELRQNLKMSQTLVMTPQLQQAIKLLQLSRIELIEQIREEVEQNPLLEEPDDIPDGEQASSAPGEASFEAANHEAPQDLDPPQPENAQEVRPENGPSEIDWEAYLNNDQFHERAASQMRSQGDGFPPFEANLVKGIDLVSHLDDQLAGSGFNDAEQRIAQLIIGNLDDEGYLKLLGVEGDPLIRLANEADVPMALAQRILRTIQHLDPIGCASRDLRECLLVQISARHEHQALLLGTIVKKHLKALEARNLAAVARELKVDVEDVVEAVKLLSKLDPKPGRNFTGEETHLIVPDVYIIKVGSEYSVVLNDDGLSKLRISEGYRQALRGGQIKPGVTREFVQEKLRSAMWLIRSIHQRQRTIAKVTESIIRYQRDFLDKGIDHLKPLILRDVAEDIGMHESTVSRVTTNKYVHTSRGIFELKYFFNSSIARTSGEDIASEAVKNHIRQLISGENVKEPYSDQRLVELLRARGITIARRTVAKYREVTGVLPSNKRKKYY